MQGKCHVYKTIQIKYISLRLLKSSQTEVQVTRFGVLFFPHIVHLMSHQTTLL